MMKHPFRRVIPLVAGVALSLGCLTAAQAAYSDFTDVSGHWASATLSQAYSDGIMKGYDATTMAPNRSITTAQAVTVLCRVLNVTGEGNTSAFDIPEGAWYAQDVAKAVYAGFLDASDVGTLESPITRGQAFCLFARAFQMVPADVDLSVLEQFPDGPYLTGETQRAAAALVEAGVVNGSEGMLKADRSLTRAEFATILYRLADKYQSADSFRNNASVGTVLSGSASLSGIKTGSILFDQSAYSVSLTDVTAQRITLRSDQLDSLKIQGSGSIDRLVVAAGRGDVSLDLPDTYTLGTLQVGTGTGGVTLSSPASSVEVTGDNRTVVVNTDLDTLTISGTGNTVTVQQGCRVESLSVTGKDNTVKLNGTANTLLLAGRDSAVVGSGRANTVTLGTKYYALTVSKGSTSKWSGMDLDGVSMQLDAPAKLAAGKTLEVTADLAMGAADKGKVCTASWYLNGELKSQETVVLGLDDVSASLTPTYHHNMSQNGTVKLVLSYENADGDVVTKEASASVTLENLSDLGLADAEITVSVPQTLSAGQTLTATATVNTPEQGQVCQGTWYVDGKAVETDTLTLGQGKSTLKYTYEYYYGMPKTSQVTYRLTYTTKEGVAQEVESSASLNLENYADNGIAKASIKLQPPSGALAAGKELVVTADLSYLEAGKVCTGYWYVDGKQVATGPVTLGTTTPKLVHTYTYTENMSLTSEIKLVLVYTTEDGRKQEISASTTVQLKNYDYLYYHGLDNQTVLNTVTSGYKGNYTLAWAQQNDYSKDMKTAWVNLKGYKSNTNYLIWVNLTYQRVNIFTGSQGNWTLVRQAICGSGKSSTPTPRGVYTTSYKQTAWNYGSYYCGPVVRFNGSSGYAFHSRLEYWPMNSDRYYDARIGFPVSHGCLRMYNDDIWYIYNNVPNGTTVVVY